MLSTKRSARAMAEAANFSLIKEAGVLMMGFQAWSPVAVVTVCVLVVGPAVTWAEPTAEFVDVQAWLKAKCVRCHGGDDTYAEVDLTAFADEESVRRNRKLWQRVAVQVESLEMPPEDEPQLAPEQREQLLAWIDTTLSQVDCGPDAVLDPGPALVRRLNRAEYDLTIRDLLGVPFDSAAEVGMPAEAVAHGYDNQAQSLALPPVLMEKYLAASSKILERVLGPIRSGPDAVAEANEPNTAPEAFGRLIKVRPGKDLTPRAAAEEVIRHFARRAYRRPVQDHEVEQLLRLFDLAQAEKCNYVDSVRLMAQAVLVSPHYLFRVEEIGSADEKPEPVRVSDHELAVRLSYFLWSSMPDEELFALAEAGTLHREAVLKQQVERMLDDPKARALTDRFAAQWLQINKLDEARPSLENFPTFTTEMRAWMYEETAQVFDYLRRANRPIDELLDADYTFVNEPLAEHYGLPGVKGPEFRKVALPEGSARGGLLGMGSMLAITSHTSRTSPTLRGTWVLEVVLGTPPPPPPTDVGMLDETAEPGREPQTLRERLAAHASQASCRGCHAKIDPLGFSLENFDAVGRWRETAAGEPIDARGELPTGERFSGPQELKQLLLARRNQFRRNLTEQILSFALGRELQYFDECAIERIAQQLAQNQGRFRVLVGEVVRSVPFQYRRGGSHTKAEP